jgi:hypothetical protein
VSATSSGLLAQASLLGAWPASSAPCCTPQPQPGQAAACMSEVSCKRAAYVTPCSSGVSCDRTCCQCCFSQQWVCFLHSCLSSMPPLPPAAFHGPVVLSKGPLDVISDGSTSIICNQPSSLRRAGGQGDVLTGMWTCWVPGMGCAAAAGHVPCLCVPAGSQQDTADACDVCGSTRGAGQVEAESQTVLPCAVHTAGGVCYVSGDLQQHGCSLRCYLLARAYKCAHALG